MKGNIVVIKFYFLFCVLVSVFVLCIGLMLSYVEYGMFYNDFYFKGL